MTVVDIPLKDVRPAGYNPDRRKAVRYCQDLIDSIGRVGQLLPCLVTRTPDGYQIVDGVRRHTALSELGCGTMKAIVVEADEAPAVYAEVTWNSKRLNGQDVLQVYLSDPYAVKESIAVALSEWKRNILVFVADHKGSLATLKQAKQVAEYCSVDKNTVAKWLVSQKMTYQARTAIETKINPELLAGIIRSGKKLHRTWEAV